MRPALCLFFGFRCLVCGFLDCLDSLMEDVWILSTAEYFRLWAGLNPQFDLVLCLARCIISQVYKCKNIVVTGSPVILQHTVRNHHICDTILCNANAHNRCAASLLKGKVDFYHGWKVQALDPEYLTIIPLPQAVSTGHGAVWIKYRCYYVYFNRHFSHLLYQAVRTQRYTVMYGGMLSWGWFSPTDISK